MGVAGSIKSKIKKIPLIGSAAVKLKGNLNKLNAVRKDVQKQFKNPNFRDRAKYASYWKKLPINNHQILYESFYGRGMLCNPRALFLELLEDPRAKDMQHIWVLDKIEDHPELIEEYKNYSNVSFVQFKSDEYKKVLCTAKYLINNSTFQPYFTKKEGQIYINTWHGIPLKKIGYDMSNGITENSNIIRNLMQVDFLISTGPELTKLLYAGAYKLKGLWNGKIVEEGYPRLDILSRYSKSEVIESLRQCDVAVDPSRKVLLYAPTFRGETYANANKDVSVYYNFKEKLEQEIDLSEYQLLIKVHQRVYELCKDELAGDFFIPAEIDANEILAVTDILITDYSSIYFDFLATNRPVLFYIPDLEEYQEQRGLYKTIDQLPGPSTKDIEELAEWINHIDAVYAEWHEAYEREREWSGAVSDGKISERIVNGIFFGDKDCHMRTLPAEKKKILFRIGGLRTNGICTSFLNLLHSFDYDRFDVSIMLSKSPDAAGQKRIEEIPPEIRAFYRNSTFNMTYWEYIKHSWRMKFGLKSYDYPEYHREFVRSFGNAKFDYVIDFNGYDLFFSLLMLQDPKARTAIWMHNDMYSEYEVRYPQLSRIFALYPFYDSLVSCSKEVMIVNREKLSDRYHIATEKFKYAKNTLDVQKLTVSVDIDPLVDFAGERYILLNHTENYKRSNFLMAPYIPEKDKNGNRNYRFVTVGRMSPEKNQIRLVEAFNRLHKEFPNTYLYIVGDGPLRREMQKTISSMKSKDAIILSGNIDNPFAIMKYCDCFVLPSLHEGQPMTIHEARALHMPIIVSNFSSVGGASLKNGQLIIGMKVNDIYEGLKSFIDGQVPSDYEFDLNQYNQEAWNEFLQAIGEE